MQISNLNPRELNLYLNSLTEEQRNTIFSNPTILLQLNDSSFFFAFQRQPSEIKQKLLRDETIARRLLTGKSNAKVRTPFEYLNTEEQKILLNHTSLLIHINENILKTILKKTSINIEELTQKLQVQLQHEPSFKDSTKLKIIQAILQNTPVTPQQIQQFWNYASQNDINQFLTFCRQKKRNAINLLIIETKNEFELYLKTNLLISEQEIQKERIPMDIIKTINSKALSQLIKLYQEHLLTNHYHLSNAKILITVLNVFLIFGYDNARKILLDFFTYATESSKIKQANLEFDEIRKEYRLTHQEEFYNHQMLNRIYQEFVMITNEEIKIEDSLLFQKILKTTAKDACRNFYKELVPILYTPNTDRDRLLEEFLKEKIKRREEKLRQEYIKDTKDKGNILPTSETLYQLFKGIDYHNCKLDEQKNPIIDKQISVLFLGNERKKNDCLLRMIISKNIFELFEHVIPMINHFPIIYKEIKRSDGILSINSLNDVIKVYQTTTYSLDYDEQDLDLSTIAKVNKSKDFIENEEINLVQELLKFHKIRKWKTFQTIPYVIGVTSQGIRYEILKNDDNKILTAGIDHNCCFKPGAKGEAFFKYCLTNPNGGIISLKEKDSKKSFIVPFIINGNTIYGNGIEPAISKNQKDLGFKLVDAIQTCYQIIAEETCFYEPIEIGILTDLHLEEETHIRTYPKIQIENNPAIEEFYCDLTKKEKQKYIIFQTKDSVNINHYQRKSKYQQPRKKTFLYVNTQYSKSQQEIKNLEVRINNIYYTYLKINEELNPQEFNPIQLKAWDIAIGNNDWFILKKGNTELKCILPYYQNIDIEVEVASQIIRTEGSEFNERKNY